MRSKVKKREKREKRAAKAHKTKMIVLQFFFLFGSCDLRISNRTWELSGFSTRAGCFQFLWKGSPIVKLIPKWIGANCYTNLSERTRLRENTLALDTISVYLRANRIEVSLLDFDKAVVENENCILDAVAFHVFGSLVVAHFWIGNMQNVLPDRSLTILLFAIKLEFQR